MSTQPCGCDPEANWKCMAYPRCVHGFAVAHAAVQASNPATKFTHFEARAAAVAAMPEAAKFERILIEIGTEFLGAACNNAPMHSLHEGYSVILEELDELKAEVWKNPRKHPDRTALARKEAIQVAAMALRLVHDVCDKDA